MFRPLFLFLAIFLIFGGLVLLPSARPARAGIADAFGEGTLGKFASGAGYKPLAGTGEETIYATIGTIIGILLSLLGVIFLGLIIYGGFEWMLARGEEAKVDKAKSIIKNAVIGLVIVLAAYAISYFVLSNLSAGLINGDYSPVNP